MCILGPHHQPPRAASVGTVGSPHTCQQSLPLPIPIAPASHQSSFCLHGFACLNISHKGIQDVAFCVWLLSLPRTFSGFIHYSASVLPCGGTQEFFSHSLQTLSCGMWDLVPHPGIKPRPPAMGVWSLTHWTNREEPPVLLF